MSKLFWSTLTVSVVLATGLCLTGQTATTPQTPAQGHEAIGSTGTPDAHLQMLSEKLNLTGDQKAKLKPILEGQAQQLRALRNDPSVTREERIVKKKAIHEETHDQINSVLTPDQQDKFRQMEQDATEKHKDMNH